MNIRPEEILEYINEGVYITDLNRQIVYWSPGAERITGWKSDEVIGTCCHDGLLEHVDKEGRKLCGEKFCPLHASMLGDMRLRVPYLIYAKSSTNERIPVEVTVAPYRDAVGKVIGGIEVFREKAEYALDMETARSIQDAFLWNDMPRGKRVTFEALMLPMEMVGGDFLRVEKIGDGAFAFMLGDVIGHGMSGALYTMLLRTIWEEFRSELINPERFVQKAGNRLASVLGEDFHFVSGIFGLFDENASTLRYCDMGGPEFLQKKSSGEIITHKSFGEMLGLGSWSSPRTELINFDAGDSFFFFTDGLIELKSSGGGMLGIDGIKNKLSAYSDVKMIGICESMKKEIQDYSYGALLHDDISMLMVTV